MQHEDMNAWQETLHGLMQDQLVPPKRIAFRLHRHSDYLSDVCRRDRVDPIAIFNAILQEAESYARTDPQRMLAISHRIFRLLTVGTGFYASYVSPALAGDAKHCDDLRDQIGPLMQDLGGAVDSLCDIVRDGAINESDAPSIAEMDFKINRLSQLLSRLHIEVHARYVGAVK